MATAANVTHRIERSLSALLAEIEDLPNVSAEWHAWPDGERASFSLSWDHLMADYLTELDEYARAGAMTPEQERRYRDLLCKLKEALPLIQRLNLYPPPVSLDV
jgi:hypothetical protein